VPVPDPIPSPRGSLKQRFWRIFRLMIVLAVVLAVIAMILVSRGDPTLHVNMLIATGLGVGFTVLLGTSLMTLVFISADSGHDEAAAPHIHDKDDE
jgi:multisubunit Na+/H+ antiporter MnhB subunit